MELEPHDLRELASDLIRFADSEALLSMGGRGAMLSKAKSLASDLADLADIRERHPVPTT